MASSCWPLQNLSPPRMACPTCCALAGLRSSSSTCALTEAGYEALGAGAQGSAVAAARPPCAGGAVYYADPVSAADGRGHVQLYAGQTTSTARDHRSAAGRCQPVLPRRSAGATSG